MTDGARCIRSGRRHSVHRPLFAPAGVTAARKGAAVLISAVLVPLILLAAVLAPGWYQAWKAYCESVRLPVSPPEAAEAGGLHRRSRWQTELARLRSRRPQD